MHIIATMHNFWLLAYVLYSRRYLNVIFLAG